MEYFFVCTAALMASGLTLFSGFGLGTLLLPAFALFFPVTTAVAMTAIVHLLNNLFKLVLLGRHTDRGVAVRFGLPAIAASFVGAFLLVRLATMEPVWSYELAGVGHQVTPVAIVIAAMMVVFAIVDVSPRFARLSLDARYLPLGGMLSGFFGGLSGHQGALRSAFLLKCGLSRAGFIGTGVVISCVVDLVRLGVYSSHYRLAVAGEEAGLLVAAVVSAFAGAFIGARLIHKVSMQFIQRLVAGMLMAIGAGVGSGLL